jgi:hypothetical protein
MIQALDTVVLTRDVPRAEDARKGDLGAVVFVHEQGRAYDVEFVTPGGETLAVVNLPAGAVRAATKGEIAHARGRMTASCAPRAARG